MSGISHELVHPDHHLDHYQFSAVADMRLFGWQIHSDDFWFRCTPPAYPFRPQGWKIHISVSLMEAADVLEPVARFLFEEDTAFKFARSADQLKMLLSHRFDRGGGAKFITVYPRHDSDFRRLVPALHRLTEDHEGPAVLSDQRYRTGSSVYFRYGAMSGSLRVHRDQGYFDVPLMDPAGEWEEDGRNAWFTQPGWSPEAPLDPESVVPLPTVLSDGGEPAVPPGAADIEPLPPSPPDGELLLNDRYSVIEAIRHSNRGGVYRATDKRSGNRVIIKEARPFIGPEDDGTDMTDRLRHEFTVLTELRNRLGVMPEPVETFEQDGHCFLVEAEIAGQNLRDWVEATDRSSTMASHERDAAKRKVIGQLCDVVAKVHALGYVLRDLSPGNVMVDRSGEVYLIDPEFLVRQGDQGGAAFTYGYASPAAVQHSGIKPIESISDDQFGLAMCIIFVCARAEPPIILPATPDLVARRSIRSWFELVRGRFPLVEEWASTLTEQLGSFLGAHHRSGDLAGSAAEQLASRDLDDGLSFLCQVDWSHTDRRDFLPWPTDSQGVSVGDAASVQTGVAGVVQLLADAARTPATNPAVEQTLANAARWLGNAVDPMTDRNLPGLYFGRSGTAWALCSAARVLGEPHLMNRAREILVHTPVRWNNPDVTHGLSGAGLAHLYFLSLQHDQLLEERLRLLADRVLERVDRRGEDWLWFPTQGADHGAPQVAVEAHLGFAHGVAGIGTFLSAAADYFEDARLAEAARGCLETLRRRAIATADGVLDWPVVVSDEPSSTNPVRWWCSGSGGIASFLIRYARQFDDAEATRLALGAAAACADEDLRLMPGHCHGISGNGQLFLDLREFLDIDLAAPMRHSAHMLRIRRIAEGPRMVIANDMGNRVSYSYGQGLAGSLAYLLRYVHHTDRPFYLPRHAFAT